MRILLARPRGFCAGVDRAIEIVELALRVHGAPVYVRHEIVHNRHVVESLRAKGAAFVDELDEVPDGMPVIFSAHGVAKSVWDDAQQRGLQVIDATCPLVIKVHQEVHRDHARGRELILIGHTGHPEVIGTLGQVPDKIHLVTTVEDVARLQVNDADALSYVTQTTLSIDECQSIVDALHLRFPSIKGPRQEDICYATQNRQNAVKEIAAKSNLLLVLGAPNSSNSNRLMEIGTRMGIRSYLIESAAEIDAAWLQGVETVGISAGASAPEVLVQEVVAFLKARGASEIQEVLAVEEDVEFQLPRELLAAARAAGLP